MIVTEISGGQINTNGKNTQKRILSLRGLCENNLISVSIRDDFTNDYHNKTIF